MVDKKQQGFTIIEVVLFLAISGLIAVVLMLGWTTSLNTQRYRDSVKSLQSFLQQQYNLTYNVENTRSDSLECDSSATVGDATPGAGTKRGTEDCVLLGRYIRIQNGTDISVSAIVGVEPSPLPNYTSDLDAIRSYGTKIVTQDIGLLESRLQVPWGAAIVDSEGNGRNLVIAIIRSPLTGTAHTYAQDTDGTPQPDTMVDDVTIAQESEQRLCVNPDAVFSGELISVVIREKASSQSAIETEPGC